MQITNGTINGKQTVTLVNSCGMTVTLGSYGAGIVSIKVPDRDGTAREITRLHEKGYGASHHGLTVGRTAGRIANATFTIDGRTAALEKNNHGTDNLHGGKVGLSYVEFSMNQSVCSDYTDIIFEYSSPDGEFGYFGNVNFAITYRVYENKNGMAIFFDATPDCKTLVNLTNHVYFNLSGDLREDVKNQVMYINASNVGVLNERSITTGFAPVTEQFDFRKSQSIGKYLGDKTVQNITGGYDHPFLLDKRGPQSVACSLYSELSGIKLNVKTTYPCAVVYSDNAGGNMAVCFECQYNPDGIHYSPNDCGICSPEKPYHEVTEFEFLIN